jgi:iron complex transport system permease protein
VQKKLTIFFSILLVTIVSLFVISLMYGTVNIPFNRIVDVLLKNDGSDARTIIWDLRLPRAIMAFLIGANLAVSGAIMQSMTKNPLAEPKLLGITAGAAAMVVVIEFFFISLPYIWFSPLVFVGAALGGAVVYSLSIKGNVSPVRLTLAGVAVSAFLHAFTVGILILLGQDAASVYTWLAGGLNGLTWSHLMLIAPWSLIGLFVALALSTKMNLIELGDDMARGLGVKVGMLKISMAILVIVLAGSSVSVAGSIGFIGLIVPHLVRKIVGPDHKNLIPYSALTGGCILLAGDFLARMIVQPIELPVGIFTAAIGCPYFLYLVRKQGDSHAK